MALNQFTELLYYIKELAEADPLVNSVRKEGRLNLDTKKDNIYPLVDIFIGSGTFPSAGVVRLNVQIVCVNERITNKEVDGDPFWGQDNEVDNMNECLEIINRIWSTMFRDFKKRKIVASNSPTITAIYESFGNVLDGWQINFDVDLPNGISLCTYGTST